MTATTGEKPRAYEHDIYLAHASEDKPTVRALKNAVERLGWRVWLDELQLVAGLSLRAQLDHGLATSRFAAVVLSPAFFRKRWPREELDALYSLEGEGLTKILPVWLGVDEQEVRQYSPILSSRFAVTVGSDIEAAAQALSDSMDALAAAEGETWAYMVRRGLREGLMWARPPEYFADSIHMLDEHFDYFLSGRNAPHDESLGSPTPVSLPDLFERTTEYDGKLIGIIGRQGRQQLLSRRRGLLNEYVIQVKTAQPGYDEYIVYVRLGEISEGPPDVPKPPPNHLIMVTGTPVARGPMHLTTGAVGNCVYFVAARLYYLPPWEDDATSAAD